MQTKIYTLVLLLAFIINGLFAQTVVKMNMPQQSDEKLKVVALFDEVIPQGIPVVLGLMGYDIVGGIAPYSYEWMLNGEVISTLDIAIFTPNKGDDLSLIVIDNNKCKSSTSFELKFAELPQGKASEITVYPTLVTNCLQIDFPTTSGKKALVRIFDTNGKVAYRDYFIESTTILVNLTPATYYVSVRIGEIHKVEKIIVR